MNAGCLRVGPFSVQESTKSGQCVLVRRAGQRLSARTLGHSTAARAAFHEGREASLPSLDAVRSPQYIADLAQAVAAPQADPTAGPAMPSLSTAALALGGLAVAAFLLKKIFDTPSRAYDQNVGQEYDAWTEEGVLEYYWGEHIHLGYYNEEEMKQGYKKKNFIQAKYDFVEEMLKWSGVQGPQKVLDVGCGIGGTSRYLAAKFPEASVTGITLSPNQVKRGTQLAADRGLSNVEFKVMDALKMEYPDNSFDLVWACESGEHMPDKAAYVAEMVRVLKPGGTLVIATWCQREETPQTPFSEDEKERLRFLYEEWAHPFFVSIEEYERIMKATGKLDDVSTADWTVPTIASWRHSIWVGVWDPWIVVFKGPRIWYKTLREIVTLERMHRAFDEGLMTYGMMRAVKKPEAQAGAALQQPAEASAA